jgi:hypothetical protein
MSYRVLELIVPDLDIQEQEHYNKHFRITKSVAMEWMKDYVDEIPEKYLLRVLTYSNNGQSIISRRDIVRTI